MGMRGVIFGFDGERQCLDRPHVERRDFFHVPLLYLDPIFFGLQSAQIQAVGAVHPVDQRQHKQRSLPSCGVIDDSNQSHRRGSDQVIRERPEVAFRPDFAARLSLRQRDHYRDRQSVGEKEHQRGDHQQNGLVRRESHREPVVAEVSERAGIGHHAGHVKQHLYGIEPFARLPYALEQRCRATDDQRLGKAQLHDAHQDEQEIHRHRAVDAWQLHLESRGQHRHRQVAGEPHQIVRLPVRQGIGEDAHPQGHSDADECLRRDR